MSAAAFNGLLAETSQLRDRLSAIQAARRSSGESDTNRVLIDLRAVRALAAALEKAREVKP